MEKNIKDALKLKDVNYHQMKKDVMNAMKNMFQIKVPGNVKLIIKS